VPEKLNEPFQWRWRFVSRKSSGWLRRSRLAGDGDRRLAHISGAHKKIGTVARPAQWKAARCCGSGNIWWGVSVEDRKHGLPRVAHLQQARAKLRFLSIEPLLEDLGEIDFAGIDWIIVGGESGPGARPMSRDWVLSIREQCRSYGIPFFFKQWGGVRKAKTGRELGGHTYDEYPQRNRAPMPDM
jgi:protein gp37